MGGTSCEKWPDGSIVSTLNNVCWIWAKRAAGANIVAILFCLAVILLELVQRRDRNVTRLAIVICILRYCAPCQRQTNVHIAISRTVSEDDVYRDTDQSSLSPGARRCDGGGRGGLAGAGQSRWTENELADVRDQVRFCVSSRRCGQNTVRPPTSS